MSEERERQFGQVVRAVGGEDTWKSHTHNMDGVF